jgi:hypothetical protein
MTFTLNSRIKGGNLILTLSSGDQSQVGADFEPMLQTIANNDNGQISSLTILLVDYPYYLNHKIDHLIKYNQELENDLAKQKALLEGKNLMKNIQNTLEEWQENLNFPVKLLRWNDIEFQPQVHFKDGNGKEKDIDLENKFQEYAQKRSG